MKKIFSFLIVFTAVLSSCVKHTEITYDSFDLTESFWMAYEVDNKELSQDEKFMFYFSRTQSLKILFLNPNNNIYEPKYSFYYSKLGDNNSAIVNGYFLTSKEFEDAILHYKKLNSSDNSMEFNLRLSPDSNYTNIKMKRLHTQ